MKNTKLNFTDEELKSLQDSLRKATFEWITIKRPEILKRYNQSYFQEENTVDKNIIHFYLEIGKIKDEK